MMNRNLFILIILGMSLLDSTYGISGGINHNGSSAMNYFVAIHNYRNDYICTATLLTKKVMITSASCLGYYSDFSGPVDDDNVMALFARQTSSDRRNRENLRRIITLIKHKNWEPQKAAYDCALLKTQGPFRGVDIVRLPKKKNEIYPGREVAIFGWGAVRENFPNEYLLHEGVVTVISMEECEDMYPGEDLDEKLVFCTHKMKVGACAGDDGGPVLTQQDSNGSQLIGIIGYRKGCGYPDYPDIHVNIYSVINFIKKQLSVLKEDN